MEKQPYKPLLIYTVGRVSSASIYNVCEKETTFTPYHVHYITPHRLEAQAAAAEESGHWEKDVTDGIEFSRRRGEYRGKPRIINIVRDPIARTLSLFFFSGQVAESDILPGTDGPQRWAGILDAFMKYDRHTEFDFWLQDEFAKYTGVDLLKTNYSAKNGWGRCETQQFDILTFQCELEDNRKIALLNSFLGAKIKAIPRDNSTAERAGEDVGNLYKSFVNDVALPVDYVDHIYGLNSSRFFYTAKQIDTFRKKWLKR